MPPDKECSKCGCWLPPTEFHRDRHGKDGHRSDCKKCRNFAIKCRVSQRTNPRQITLAESTRKSWTVPEEAFLTRHYKRNGPAYCADRLGRSKDAVKCHWLAMRRRQQKQ